MNNQFQVYRQGTSEFFKLSQDEFSGCENSFCDQASKIILTYQVIKALLRPIPAVFEKINNQFQVNSLLQSTPGFHLD